jgi:hypothetical protein
MALASRKQSAGAGRPAILFRTAGSSAFSLLHLGAHGLQMLRSAASIFHTPQRRNPPQDTGDTIPGSDPARARDCGKTRHFVDGRYFDLEKPSDLQAFSGDIEYALQNLKGPLILDEAQTLPALFPVLRSSCSARRKSLPAGCRSLEPSRRSERGCGTNSFGRRARCGGTSAVAHGTMTHSQPAIRPESHTL